MGKKTISTSLGNGALDILLFTPLALFFLFVVIDGGLALVERAAVTDALRAGLAAEGLYRRENPLLYPAADNSLEVDRAAVRGLISAVAGEIEKNIRAAKPVFNSGENSAWGIEVSAVILEIDSQSGALQGADGNFQVLDSIWLPAGGFAEVGLRSAGYPFVSREDFIRQELEQASGAPSSYAQPLGPSFRADLPQASPAVIYLENGIALYVEARSIASGIGQGHAQAVLGRLYTLQLQHFFLLRTQLG